MALRGGGARAASVAAARSAGRAGRLASRGGGAFTRAAKAPKGGIRGLKRSALIGGALGSGGGGDSGYGSGGPTSSLGGAAGSLGVFGLGGPAKGTKINLPAMAAPESTSKVSAPSISTITEQLTLLVSLAKDIGANIDSQKDSLISEIKDANRMAEADQLDAGGPDASPVGPNGEMLGVDLSSPLNDFGSALDNLIEAIKGLSLSGGGGGGGGGLLGGLGGAAAAVAGTAGAAAAGKAIASRVGGRAAAGAGAQALSSGSIRRTISRIAGPLLAKRLGGTALRSIPLLGTAIGVGFAVNSLIKGDLVGAGLNLTSGIAGPVTAIPAMILQLAREIYSGVYGVNPEADPLANDRMAVIVKELEKMAKSALAPRIRRAGSTQTPDARRVPSGNSSPPPRPAPAAASSPSPGARTTPPLAVPSVGGGSPQNRVAPGVNERAAAQTGGAAAAPGAAPAAAPISSPAPGAMSAPAEPAAPGGGEDGVVESPSISVPSPQQLVNSAPSVAGADIIRASDNADPMLAGVSAAGVAYSMPGNRVGPARQSTTRQGMVGVGNVPSPDYSFAGDIAVQLYFAEAA
jgi:hypothetical protein